MQNQQSSPGRQAFNAHKRFNITRELLNTVVHNLGILGAEDCIDGPEVQDLMSDTMILRRRIDRLHQDYANALIEAADKRMPNG